MTSEEKNLKYYIMEPYIFEKSDTSGFTASKVLNGLIPGSISIPRDKDQHFHEFKFTLDELKDMKIEMSKKMKEVKTQFETKKQQEHKVLSQSGDISSTSTLNETTIPKEKSKVDDANNGESLETTLNAINKKLDKFQQQLNGFEQKLESLTSDVDQLKLSTKSH
jgi:chromosome segregation ATPase